MLHLRRIIKIYKWVAVNRWQQAVMLLVQSHHKDFELLSFWLSNMYQLLNCLKQYSGEEVWICWKYPLWHFCCCFCGLFVIRQHVLTLFCFAVCSQKEYMKQNTPRQKKNCLQNFDLSEHRQILSDVAIQIYHQFITIMEKSLTPAIGILQFSSSLFI